MKVHTTHKSNGWVESDSNDVVETQALFMFAQGRFGRVRRVGEVLQGGEGSLIPIFTGVD